MATPRTLEPVQLRRVDVGGPFWATRLEVNRRRTIPAIHRQLVETGRLDAYRLHDGRGDGPTPHLFWDSDVAKWIEAAAYTLAKQPDPALQAMVRDAVERLASIQQPDGYLNVYFTTVAPSKRWTNLGMWHELYCAGHLIEAGVALYEATGDRSLLDVVARYADHIDATFGPGRRAGCCGHPEIELALVKLYRATHERRYLALSQFFLDQRGRRPSIFEEELGQLPPEDAELNLRYLTRDGRYDPTYCQDHLPVRDQSEAVGHAVRAMYLAAGMADVGLETGDAALVAAARRIWESATGRKMYVTGGLGSRRDIEGFGPAYELPDEDAYAETCAAIGLVLLSHRLFHAHPHGRYVDVLERALYNGVLAGVSLDGERFFYENPLASSGHHHRQPWYEVACCPPNLARLLASLGQYAYSEGPQAAFVHLYVGGKADLVCGDVRVTLHQQTDYPWDGRVRLTVVPEKPVTLTLYLRVPGWCPAWSISVNGEPLADASRAAAQAHGVPGYVALDRFWRPGDTVELTLAMPVQRLYGHPRSRDLVGRVALQRGPLVYCLEEHDNGPGLDRIVLPMGAPIESRFDEALLGGVVVLSAEASELQETDWEGGLYRTSPPALHRRPIVAIPYFAWDNRSPGEMRVWLRDRS